MIGGKINVFDRTNLTLFKKEINKLCTKQMIVFKGLKIINILKISTERKCNKILYPRYINSIENGLLFFISNYSLFVYKWFSYSLTDNFGVRGVFRRRVGGYDGKAPPD